MKTQLIISLICVGMLTACSNDNDGPVQNDPELTPAQKIEKMERSGEIPRLDRTDTIGGIDTDNNGVRDDIDEYIKKTYPSAVQQKALLQYARSLQKSLLLEDKQDLIAVKAVTNEKARAISCISLKVPGGKSPNGDRVVQEILSLHTNTKKRLEEYWKLDIALNGTTITLPIGDVCDE